MKKYILILGLLFTTVIFSQGGYTKPVVTAINVTIADAGAIITATEVENALQENRALINLNTIPHLEFNNTDKTVWNNGKSNISSNTSFGDGALKSNTNGVNNVAVGVQSLESNTGSNNNTAVGYHALLKELGTGNTGIGQFALGRSTDGFYNTAVGSAALAGNTTGTYNTSIGNGSLSGVTTGDYNSGFGTDAMPFNTSGSYNTVGGYVALTKASSGSNNLAIGWESGGFLNNGTTNNTTPENSVFLGTKTRALTATDTNQIVIGYNALGQGTNTVVLGNDNITDTYLKGNINGGAFIKNGGLSTEFLKADGSVSTGGGGGASFKEYTATLAQTSTNAPVATIIFNDLGQVPVWTRTGVGLYSLTVTGNAWVLNKTIVHLTNANTSGGGLSGKVSSTSIIGVFSFATSTGSNSDTWEGTITVKVYD